ncbi:Yip1 family protein, partial [Paenibacillus sp. MCAF20]
VLGLAKAAYKKGEYERAQALFKQAGWAQGYSDSFWQNRLLWFQSNFGLLMNVVIGALLIFFAARFTARRLGFGGVQRKGARSEQQHAAARPLLRQLGHAFYVLKHPIDGFHSIRYEQKGGLLSSTILFVLALVSYAIMRAAISFIFNPSIIVEVQIVTILIQFIVVWLSFVIANYLISSLYHGEGRFRDVLYGSAYALFPFILLGIPITLISNVMTLSEQSIFTFLEYGLYVWVALLFFWMVQGIQNYSVGETLINLLLSIITMAICAVLVFIVFSLTSELFNFIYSVYQEVTIR